MSLFLAACAAASLAAQAPVVSGGASFVSVRSQGVGSGGPTRASGTMLGGALTARFGRVEVEGRYLQGALQSRDVVQGQLGVRFHPVPWAYAQAATRARAFVTPAETERWMMWLVGVGVEAPVVSGRTTILGDVGLWRALALSANVGSTDGRAARGGEAGVTLQLLDRPWWVRLSYGIDRSAVAGAARRETVEELTLTVGVRRR